MLIEFMSFAHKVMPTKHWNWCTAFPYAACIAALSAIFILPAMSMYKAEDYLLGNSNLHFQLSTALAVMTQLICNPSRPPNTVQMSQTTEIPARHLRKLMRTLSAGGLLKPHPGQGDTWVCARPPHAISLADIYYCLTEERDTPSGPFIPVPQADAASSGAELLMMQATMAINQLVLQQLQQFDLGRLKVAETAIMFTAALREKAWIATGADEDTQWEENRGLQDLEEG